jgi:endo-1,3(4)-beta-glucanase
MSDAAAEPRRRSWLRRLAATQAVLILAVVALRRTPQTNPELLQHGPRDLGYRTARKIQGRAPGAALTTHLRGPLPTNSWWLDLARSPADDPSAAAYAVPFLFEKTSRGLRASPTHLQASPDAVLTLHDARSGLVLGTTEKMGAAVVKSAGELGVVLAWPAGASAPVTRGAAFLTMRYDKTTPLIHSEAPLHLQAHNNITVDGVRVACDGRRMRVKNVIELVTDADQQWALYTDAPLQVTCTSKTSLELLATAPQSLTLRAALLTACAYGTAADACSDQGDVRVERLKQNRALFGGAAARTKAPSTTSNDLAWELQDNSALLTFSFHDGSDVFYALDQHVGWGALTPAGPCVDSLNGVACPVVGTTWKLRVPLGPEPSLKARRVLSIKDKRAIRDVLKADVTQKLPAYYSSGAGDTYFSGKEFARRARLAVIADEVHEPDTAALLATEVLAALRAWLNPKNAAAPFLYDGEWGGLVNCGCAFDEVTQQCTNNPLKDECPNLGACGADFGNAFYNDHHFHYGYFSYAAAVACQYAVCSRDDKARFLLLARDYANPTSDAFAVAARHKDWYLGHSWASGVCEPGNPNGRNQESSSEAVHAYEASYLLASRLGDRRLQAVSRVLAATEVDATQRYWHAATSPQVPLAYERPVVGMRWSTIAQFGTWFGGNPVFSYGIQLIPLTPYAEVRDSVAFSRALLPFYERDCDKLCEDEGWSISLIALKAAAGDRQHAWDKALALDAKAFDGAGGDGHSRANLLYWIATRDPGLEKWATPAPSAAVKASPPPISAPVPDCVDGPGLAASRNCPATAPHVCYAGPSRGGCSRAPWKKLDCARSCKRPKGFN